MMSFYFKPLSPVDLVVDLRFVGVYSHLIAFVEEQLCQVGAILKRKVKKNFNIRVPFLYIYFYLV